MDYEKNFLENLEEEAYSSISKKPKIKIRRTCIVGHLSSPITELDSEFLLNNDASIFKGCRRHFRLKKKIEIDFKGNVTSLSLSTKDPLGYLQRWIKQEKVDVNKRLKMIQLSVNNILHHKMNYLKPFWRNSNPTKIILEKQIKEYIYNSINAITELKAELEDMIKVEKIKDNICFIDIVEGDCIVYRNLHAEPDICFLQNLDGSAVIFSTNLLLCALDKLQSRFNLLLYSKLADIKKKYPGFSMYKELHRRLGLLEWLRSKIGNDVYKILNSLEPLIIGWTVKNTNDLGCGALYENSLKDINDVLKTHKIKLDIAKEFLFSFHSDNGIKLLIELTGMVKSLGYPILEARETLNQVLAFGVKENSEIDMHLIQQLDGIGRREFCYNYYNSTGHSPQIIECPRELSSLLLNKLPPSQYFKEYSRWSRVKFGKTLDYDYSPDQSELIKDSACSLNRSSWANMYDPCAFKAMYGKPPPPKVDSLYSTRVINEYLTATKDEVKILIKKRDNGIMDFEDHICVQCQKECEINVKGRAFTKQTPPQRLIQVSLEHNIADGVFRFVPEQSMTDGEIKVVMRILQQVAYMQKESHFVNLDLKKWCHHQRHLSNEFLGAMYDELFGFRCLYRFSHLFFNGCAILPNHRLCPPNYLPTGKPMESRLFTSKFVGGMEGLQQKKWTHGAILLIKLTLEQNNLKGEIMGQGDNQVILLHFDKDDSMKDEKRTKFLERLELNFRRTGHKLKEQETWFSKRLHEYSKQRIYNGAAVSYALKKSSKLIPDINDGLFSIPSSYSTINTITEGIARADYDPDIAFTLNSINITNYSARKNILKIPTENEVLFYLNWPIDFGGLNLSNYHSHAVRGNDDKISIWLSILADLKYYNRDVFDLCMSRWLMEPHSPASCAEERRNLYEDIHSLNIKPYPSAESKIKDKVVNFLKSDEVTNSNIRVLYDESHSIAVADLLTDIDKLRPVFPPLGHELLSNSNAGLFIKLQGKLTNSKTLEKVVNTHIDQDVSNDYISLIQLIQDQNAKMISEIKKRTSKCKYHINRTYVEKDYCPTDVSDKLRTSSWGLKVIGVTKPAWQEQVIVEDLDDLDADDINKCITIRVSEISLNNPACIHREFGTKKSFVGSKTKSKILKKATLAIQEKSSFAKSLIKLSKTRSWLLRIGDGPSVNLCDNLIEEKRQLVDIPEDQWACFDELINCGVGGNLFHRFKSSIDRDSAMVNCLPTITGHFEYSSTSMKDLTMGGKDFNVFYQYLYTACTIGLAMIAHMTGTIRPVYGMKFVQCCFKETPNPKISTQGVLIPRKATYFSSEPVCLTVNYPINMLQSMMSVVLGVSIARNIDINYKQAHNKMFETSVGRREYKKIEGISYNDVRQLDFSLFIFICLVFSRHVQKLLSETNNVMRCITEDRSFIYLAEVIIECQKVEELIYIIGSKSDEHSTTTTCLGLSSYISKNVERIISHFLVTKKEHQIYMLSTGNSTDWHTMFKTLSLKKCFSHDAITVTKQKALKHKLNNSLDYAYMGKMIGLNMIKSDLTAETVISSWKIANREELRPPKVTITKIATNPTYGEQYPFNDISIYADRRNYSTGSLKVPQLSFIARPIGSISSAANKVTECLIAAGIYPCHKNSKGTYYALAEGSGSMCTIVSQLFPNVQVAYNTWMRPDISHREFVTDISIPAWTEVGLSTDRLLPNNPLIRGETDITTEKFITKLTKCFKDHPPFLVTMDAESSVYTSNIQFLVKVMIPILKFTNKAILIFKMFRMSDFDTQIKKLLEPFKDIVWTIFKPISSNPVGCECYLIVLPIQYSQNNNYWKDCTRLYGVCKRYIGPSMTMDPETVSMYIELAKRVSYKVSAIFPDDRLQLNNKYSKIPGKYCSLFCPKFLDEIMNVVDKIHISNKDFLVNLTVRGRGINAVLYGLIHDLVFLFTYHSSRNNTFAQNLMTLSSCAINRDIENSRKEKKGHVYLLDKINEGDVWGTWHDARMYMRELGKLTQDCLCTPTFRIWNWNVTTHIKGENMLSYQVYRDLVDLAKIHDWTLYNRFRMDKTEKDLSFHSNLYYN